MRGERCGGERVRKGKALSRLGRFSVEVMRRNARLPNVNKRHLPHFPRAESLAVSYGKEYQLFPKGRVNK